MLFMILAGSLFADPQWNYSLTMLDSLDIPNYQAKFVESDSLISYYAVENEGQNLVFKTWTISSTGIISTINSFHNASNIHNFQPSADPYLLKWEKNFGKTALSIYNYDSPLCVFVFNENYSLLLYKEFTGVGLHSIWILSSDYLLLRKSNCLIKLNIESNTQDSLSFAGEQISFKILDNGLFIVSCRYSPYSTFWYLVNSSLETIDSLDISENYNYNLLDFTTSELKRYYDDYFLTAMDCIFQHYLLYFTISNNSLILNDYLVYDESQVVFLQNPLPLSNNFVIAYGPFENMLSGWHIVNNSLDNIGMIYFTDVNTFTRFNSGVAILLGLNEQKVLKLFDSNLNEYQNSGVTFTINQNSVNDIYEIDNNKTSIFLHRKCYNNGNYASKLYICRIDSVNAINNYNIPIPESKITSYPNPFKDFVQIKYNSPNYSEIEAAIFNIKGQKVRDFKNSSKLKEFSVKWDGNDNNNCKVSSGIYFIKIKANNQIVTHKLLLIK